MPVAVVTGASRGLGAAFAKDLAARGFALGLCATTEPVFGGARCRSVDVADADAVARFASEVAQSLGSIDLWINNAAILGPIGPLGTTSPEAWARCVDVNLLGVVNGTRALLAHRSPDRATLVNVASRAAGSPAAGLTAYSSTKSAVVALTLAVAAEEKDSGLRAFAVIPPSFDTDMQDTLLAQDPHDFPAVVESQRRKSDGEVLPTVVVARQILDALLSDEATTAAIVDLTQA